MNLGPCKTNDDAAKALIFIRDHKPFKYGGLWYVAAHNGKGFAYRSQQALVNRIRDTSISGSCEILLVGEPRIDEHGRNTHTPFDRATGNPDQQCDGAGVGPAA